ncbi:hypothetical protein P170DRAFT_414839 [Aspergillus steynii IBT 23096]|uniref:Zn(2)-C6 fungal-type domain-containing protein n=1 Tax=Aspergillus steynii IBT 23096 TaxID=1392250 RepID=A0A2I2FZH5_9EURO|nr:uncharacterized protein P170DRAFT_414839 [Aspergillus steynii IBT 23096]PLB46037.1 hypothetical protein P170DRAFT_414839 [Aspergillus steynii IBT 23096]
MADAERRTTPYFKICKSCEQCRLRKVRCIVTRDNPSRCTHCTKRNEDCEFRHIKRRFRAQAQATTNRSVSSASQHSHNWDSSRRNYTQTTSVITPLFVDHLLDSPPSGAELGDEAYIFKVSVITVSSSNLAFFSEQRIQSLSQRLGNNRLVELLESIETVISHRVMAQGNVSISPITFKGPSSSIHIPREAARLYIDAYFQHFHSLYPFLDRQRFERTALGSDIARTLDSDAAFSALYHAVLALGCQYRDGGTFDPGKGKAWKLFQISLCLMADILSPTESLLKLQALTAMSIFALNTCCIQIDELLIMEAARMAQTLRYHRSIQCGDQQICCQRTFWVIYIMEKQLVFHNRVNSIIVDFDIGCPIPDTPEASFGGCNWFLSRVRFARITSQAYELLFSISASVNTEESYYTAIDHVEDRLERWKMALPGDFRPGGHRSYSFSDPGFKMGILQTHCSYYSLVIALARLTIQISPEKGHRHEDSKRKLMESARRLIELTQYIDKAPHTPIFILGVIPLVALFILFDFVVHNPLHPETKTNLSMLDIASGHFNLVEHASNGSLPSSGISEFSHIARQYVRDFPANNDQERVYHQVPTRDSNPDSIVPTPNVQGLSESKPLGSIKHANPAHIPVDREVDVDLGQYDQVSSWGEPVDYLYYPTADFNVDIDDPLLHGFDVRTLFGSIIPDSFAAPADDYQSTILEPGAPV